MRKLGHAPTKNWERQEITAASTDFTGHWNKDLGSVWVQPGASYMDGGGEGIALAEGVTSESDAYEVFGSAGYVRYDNLGPTPGIPQVWSCTLSIGNKFASTKTAALSWSENRGEFYAEQAGPDGNTIMVSVYLPPAPVGWVYSFGSDEQTFGSGEGFQSPEEAKAAAEADLTDWTYEHS